MARAGQIQVEVAPLPESGERGWDRGDRISDFSDGQRLSERLLLSRTGITADLEINLDSADKKISRTESFGGVVQHRVNPVELDFRMLVQIPGQPQG